MSQARKIIQIVFMLYALPISVVYSAELESTGRSVDVLLTDHFLFSNAKNAGDSTGPDVTNLFMHEDTLRGLYREYEVSLNFSNRFFINAPSEQNQPFILEKKTASAEWNRWDLKLGDSHQEVGRGIALSLYRDPVFGIDNTAEGISARFHPRGLDSTLFVGRVNALIAPVAINPVPNPLQDPNRTVWIAGSSAKVELSKDSKIGAHYVLALNQPQGSSEFNQSWHTVGLTFTQDNLFEGVDAYLESNILTSYMLLAPESLNPPRGFGSYGSLVWSPRLWKVKWEVKDYRNDDFDFRRPPTLEEDIVPNANINNVSASRFSVERRFEGTRTSVFTSYLVGADRILNDTLHHVVAGTKFEGPARSEFELKTGYRSMPGLNDMLHASIKAKVKTFKGQLVELLLQKQYSNTDFNLQTKDDRNLLNLTYTFSEKFNTSLGYEFVPTNPGGLGTQFINLSANLKWANLITRAFLGQTSGGTICSGGVCRQVPPYNGAMLESTYKF